MIEDESLATTHEGIDLARPDYSRKPPPLPAPGRFKTLLQLRSWAGERFPRATLVTEGLDLKAWNRISPVIDSLAIDWPGVARELGWITTRHPLWEVDVQGAIAAAESIFGEKIAFNPFYFSRPKLVAETAANGERTGWHPAGAGSAAEVYFVSHEWGQLVHAWLRRHDTGKWKQSSWPLFAMDPNGAHDPPVDPGEGGQDFDHYAKQESPMPLPMHSA